MSIKSRVLPLFLLILTLDVSFCWAQEEPTIEIPAFHFTETLPTFAVGGNVDFAINPADLVRAGGPDSLQARVFRGSLGSLKDRRPSSSGDGCLFYRAAIYSVGQSPKGLQLLTGVQGPPITLITKWLSRDEPAVGGDQYFVVVIEKRTVARDTLKIRPEDVSRYFARGLQFVVKSNRRPSLEEERELVASGRESMAETVAAANRESPRTGSVPVKSRCLTFSVIQTTGIAYLSHDPCPGTLWAQAPAATPGESNALIFATLGAL